MASSSLGLKDVELLGAGPPPDPLGDEELSSSSPQQRNWRGIATALLVIAAMCSLIALAVLLLTPPLLDADAPQQRVSLSDVLTHRFLSSVEGLEWISPRRLLVRFGDSVKVLELDEAGGDGNGKTKWEWKDIKGDLYRHGKMMSLALAGEGERYVVMGYGPSKRSDESYFLIYDTKTDTYEKVGPIRSQRFEDNVRVLAWNPTGNDYAYSYKNNIYHMASPELAAENQTQLTNSTHPDLIHGQADWLYEEELLQTAQAMWWSLNGQQLAFLTIDNRQVEHMPIPYFGQIGRHSWPYKYPRVLEQPYPKAGMEALPQVWLSIWNKKERKMKRMLVDGIEPSARVYLFSAQWIQLHGQHVLIAVWANKEQNNITFSLCKFDTSKCVPILQQKFEFEADNDGRFKKESGGEEHLMRLWAEPEDSQVQFFTPDAFFTLLPHRRPNGNVYTHVARVNVPRGLDEARETFLEMDDYDVERIVWLDEKRQKIYFTAAAPIPAQRHLYVTSIFPSFGEKAVCISCNFSSNCTYHDTQFSNSLKASSSNESDAQFIVLNCKGPGTPHIIVAKLNVGEKQLEKVFEFGRNEDLEDALYTHKFPKVHFERIKLPNGIETLAKILVPYGVKLEDQRPENKYPVLIDVYAGPGTQKVSEEWLSNNMLDIFYASALEYIIVFIDGRGSGYQGWHTKQPLYGNFGTVEVDDQIETTRFLLKKYPVMDQKRVGIWGWSYGGFVSAIAVKRDQPVNRTFNCVASVAPVAQFGLYDATYVERYMDTFDSERTRRADLTKNMAAFHNVSFLLAHGTGDDNVHYQNTAEIVKALTKENVQFQLMVYTDELHNLSRVRLHLYTMLTQFFQKCFGKKVA